VILSSGAFVPRDIAGRYLRDRIDEWHRRNPNQLAAGTLFNAVFSKDKPVILMIREPAPFEAASYQLTAQDHIAALEAELFNLKVRHQPGFIPVIRTRKQHAAEKATEPDETEIVAQPQASTKPTSKSKPTVEDTSTSTQPAESQLHEPIVTSPEHLFRKARDAIYIPPQDCNVGALPKPLVHSNVKKPDPAYRTCPTIHDTKIATDIYQHAFDTPVMITYHKLLSLSPEVRTQVQDAITSKRVAPKEVTQLNILYEPSLTEEELSYLMPDEMPLPFAEEIEPTSIMALSTPSAARSALPANAIIVEDPIEQYYWTLGKGEEPDPDIIQVAKESSVLRSILSLVNNHLKFEAILDPGCQIVAMSEDVCHELALLYNPTIVLHMQSANGTVDPSLGLARNVPFLVGDLRLYMQVHVIRNPAYDILLGRSSDALTESVVQNFRNEDQTITIHDPNSDCVVTLPTMSRGPPRILSKCKKQVFHK